MRPVFVYVPILWSLCLSFFDARNTVTPTDFVGLGNYAYLLTDRDFLTSLGTFAVIALFIVPTTYVCALGLALLLNKIPVAQAFFRSAFFLPTACSSVIAVAMARALLNSPVVAVLQTVATVLISAMAAYGLARLTSRAASVILTLTVLTLLVPAAVTFVPSFVMVSSLGWTSSLRGLIVFSAFATFLFRQFFLGFRATWRRLPRSTAPATGGPSGRW